MNGFIKKGIGAGTIVGIISGSIAFAALNMTLIDRFRGQGAQAAEVRARVDKALEWQAEYDRNVRPLRDQFIRFTGQLPGLLERMDDLKSEMRRLSDRLDRLERKQPATYKTVRDTP